MPTANYGTSWWYNPDITDIIPLSLLDKLAWQLSCHLCQQPGYHLCFLSVKLRIFFSAVTGKWVLQTSIEDCWQKIFPCMLGWTHQVCHLSALHTGSRPGTFSLIYFSKSLSRIKVLWCATTDFLMLWWTQNLTSQSPSVLIMKKILKQQRYKM